MTEKLWKKEFDNCAKANEELVAEIEGLKIFKEQVEKSESFSLPSGKEFYSKEHVMKNFIKREKVRKEIDEEIENAKPTIEKMSELEKELKMSIPRHLDSSLPKAEQLIKEPMFTVRDLAIALINKLQDLKKELLGDEKDVAD